LINPPKKEEDKKGDKEETTAKSLKDMNVGLDDDSDEEEGS